MRTWRTRKQTIGAATDFKKIRIINTLRLQLDIERFGKQEEIVFAANAGRETGKDPANVPIDRMALHRNTQNLANT